MPTLRPRSRKPSAILTAVVDLPTPPLPEATAITASTPGIPGCTLSAGWARADAARRRHWPPDAPVAVRREAAPAARSAVSATSADVTPGTARTAFSAASRTGSQALTVAASTVIEKNTLPSETTMSDSTRASVSCVPPGAGTRARAAITCSLVTAIVVVPARPTCHFGHTQFWPLAATIGAAARRSTAPCPKLNKRG